MFAKTLPRMVIAVALIALLAGMATPALAQGGPSGIAISNLNIRSGPGETFEIITTIPRGTSVAIEARNRPGDWLRVHTEDRSARGWVVTRYLALAEGVTLDTLPVIDSEWMAPIVTTTEERLALLASEPPDVLIARLNSWPVMPTTLAWRVQEIFLAGRQNGMQARAFAKVGDCMTDSEAFLNPFGLGLYDLGPYDELQAVIDFFSVSPRPEVGLANSFVADSEAAYTGFNAVSVLDPAWQDPAVCLPNEGSLACEYRLTRPATAIVLFGAVDIQSLTLEQFDHYLRRIVIETIRQGIIPVLSTFPSSPDYLWLPSLQFNNLILQVAEEQELPLVNLWLASRSLPNYGLAPDNHRLSYSGDLFVSFNGDEAVWGYTLRNLLTLQVLDLLRREVLTF